MIDPAEAWDGAFDSLAGAIAEGLLTTPEEVTAYAASVRAGLIARVGWAPPQEVSESIVADLEAEAADEPTKLWTPGS